MYRLSSTRRIDFNLYEYVQKVYIGMLIMNTLGNENDLYEEAGAKYMRHGEKAMPFPLYIISLARTRVLYICV